MGKFIRNTLIIAVLLSGGIYAGLRYLQRAQPVVTPSNIFTVTSQATVIEYEGMRLDIPEGSVDTPLEVVINKVSDRNETGDLTDEFDLQPEGLTFNKWVKLTLPYNPRAISDKARNITLSYKLSNGHVMKLPFTIDRKNLMLLTWIREL